MKKRTLLFTLLLSSLSITSAFLLTNNLNNRNETKEVSATVNHRTSGLFTRVTDVSELTESTEILFASRGGYAVDDIWGNPGFVHMTRDGVKLSTGDLLFVENSTATTFFIVRNTDDTYSFLATFEICRKDYDSYLAVNDRNYAGEFDGIGYWYGDRTGISRTNDDNRTRWNVSFNDGQTYVTSVSHGGSLAFTSGYSDRLCRSNYPDVDIYKRADDMDYSIDVVKQPTKHEYNEYDRIDLSGTKITFSYKSGDPTDYTYDENRDLFSSSMEYAKKDPESSTRTVTCYFVGKPFNIEITVNEQIYGAYKVTSALDDYRGTYIISDGNYGYGFDAAQGGANAQYKCRYLLGGADNLVIADNIDDYGNLLVSVIKVGGKYSLKISDNKYLDLSNDEINIVTNPVTIPTIRIDFEDGMAAVKNSDGDYFYSEGIGGDEDYFFGVGFIGTREKMHLYKCPVSSETETEVDNYVGTFINGTSVCDETGVTDNVTAVWGGLKNLFNALSSDAKGVFGNVRYTHNMESSGSIEDMVDRYDYIINKYGLENFMERSDAVQDKSYLSVTNISNNVIDTSVTTISVIIVILVVSTLGAIVLIKKRKTNY